jgi:DTW domain-containing protein YfiP
MKPALCLCPWLTPRTVRTAVRVVVHETELLKSTNSGRLVPLLVGGGELVVYGSGRPALPARMWPEDTRPVVLFPLEGAPTVDTVVDDDPRPFSLIVLDGTWHQANRLRKRFHHLRVPFVRLPADASPSLYRLRRGHFGASLSTLEATARALAVLEGDDAVAAHLVDGFRRMQDRTLWLRGALPADAVYGGLPEGLQRHVLRDIAEDAAADGDDKIAATTTPTGDG